MKYLTNINKKDYLVEIIDDKHVSIDGKVLEVDFAFINGQPVYSMLIDGKSHEAYIYQNEDGWEVLLHGHFYPAKIYDEREKRLDQGPGTTSIGSGEFKLKAPMPGLVVAVTVEEGQIVHKGETLIILESMKMQNELKSPRDGTACRIKVKSGERVEQKSTLLTVT